MDIYDVEAPAAWRFEKYNKDVPAIRAHLRESGASALHIPYRCNRAILFNSDLFHATQALNFADGYENRHINVTFLYGRREEVDPNG